MRANGQELKCFNKDCKNAPDILCIQVTWVKPVLDFTIKGYDSVCRDREEVNGCGCIIFIKQDTQFGGGGERKRIGMYSH